MTDEELLNEMGIKPCKYTGEFRWNTQKEEEQDKIVKMTFSQAWKRLIKKFEEGRK